MSNLVIKSERGADVTTSLIVAEVFEKNHAHVMRDIREMACSEAFRQSNFGLILKTTDLGHGRQREDPYYEITKDGFSFLVMGYTGEKAAKFKEDFIEAFNKNEALLKDEDYIMEEAMRIATSRVKRLEERLRAKEIEMENKDRTIELQESSLSKQAPKVEYHDKVLQSTSAWTTTTIAKEFGLSAIKLNKILCDAGIQFYRDKHWILYAKYANMELTKTRTFTYTKEDGSTGTSIETVWTEKGRQFIHGLVKDKVSA